MSTSRVGFRVQVAEDIRQRERVLRPQRQHQRVFGGGGLQLEVELAAETLAQGEPPGLVDAAAERRVQHELHAAGLVEEPLEHERVLRGNHPERAPAFGEVRRDLFGGLLLETGFRDQPLDGAARAVRIAEPSIELASADR